MKIRVINERNPAELALVTQSLKKLGYKHEYEDVNSIVAEIPDEVAANVQSAITFMTGCRVEKTDFSLGEIIELFCGAVNDAKIVFNNNGIQLTTKLDIATRYIDKVKDLPLKLYYYLGFKGHYPVGTSAIVVAKNRDEAAHKFLEKLPQAINPDRLIEVDLTKSDAYILTDGNY